MKFKSSNNTEENKPVLTSTFKPSDMQQAALDWTLVPENAERVAGMIAVAGAGKSKTIEWISSIIYPNFERMLMCCFNSHIRAAADKKPHPDNMENKTYHQVGLGAIYRAGMKPKIDSDGMKVESILKARMGSNRKFLFSPIKKLASQCKMNGIYDADYNLLDNLAADFDVELYEDQPDLRYEIFEMTKFALKQSVEMAYDIIDFDDMIGIPLVMGLQPQQYDAIFADEFQDTSDAQGQLTRMAMAGMLLAVGDPNQSIYAFRGADSQSMQRLFKEFGADQLPLTISYRCPMAVGDYVRQEFPYIKFDSPEWAKPGLVENKKLENCLPEMKSGDLVLSRVKKNLPKIAFALIRQGTTARIRGTDIGKNLKSMIVKMKAFDLPDLYRKMDDYRTKKFNQYMQQDRVDRIVELDDKIETIHVMAENCDTLGKLLETCVTMFSDDSVGVTCSTVHKAKGSEAEHVYIASPELMPLPFVMKKGSEEDKQQEQNIRYVASTRSLDTLTLMEGEL